MTIYVLNKKNVLLTFRSSSQMCSVWKCFFRNFVKFWGKYQCQCLLFNNFNKVADLRPAILFKKRLWHRCFPVNFAKIPRTLFLQNNSGRLLLNIYFFARDFSTLWKRSIFKVVCTFLNSSCFSKLIPLHFCLGSVCSLFHKKYIN